MASVQSLTCRFKKCIADKPPPTGHAFLRFEFYENSSYRITFSNPESRQTQARQGLQPHSSLCKTKIRKCQLRECIFSCTMTYDIGTAPVIHSHFMSHRVFE